MTELAAMPDELAVAQAIGRVLWGAEVEPRGNWIVAARAAIGAYEAARRLAAPKGNGLCTILAEALCDTAATMEQLAKHGCKKGADQQPAIKAVIEKHNHALASYDGLAAPQAAPSERAAPGVVASVEARDELWNCLNLVIRRLANWVPEHDEQIKRARELLARPVWAAPKYLVAQEDGSLKPLLDEAAIRAAFAQELIEWCEVQSNTPRAISDAYMTFDIVINHIRRLAALPKGQEDE